MPARSEAQRRFIFGVKGKAFAKAHGFDNKGKLPARVGKKRKGKTVKRKKGKVKSRKRSTKRKGKMRGGRR